MIRNTTIDEDEESSSLNYTHKEPKASNSYAGAQVKQTSRYKHLNPDLAQGHENGDLMKSIKHGTIRRNLSQNTNHLENPQNIAHKPHGRVDMRIKENHKTFSSPKKSKKFKKDKLPGLTAQNGIYKPYTLSDFEGRFKNKYVEMGGLGHNRDVKWNEANRKLEKMKKFSTQIGKINSQNMKIRTSPPPREISKRDRAIEFAMKIKKPRIVEKLSWERPLAIESGYYPSGKFEDVDDKKLRLEKE
eukprot:CAMPEP_0197008244 /NCGR_PEP_ID=MMETSP1380-20130617/44474_1 /TAXON_ID=5936 /ORGANISM="Euplotes crassus, Strain CT5" /LENGTH=244 /DNA_ID=CAMNT_0042428747 /DNA_START=517 /DNA_END=1249 /DNA_ORIENTATION=-